MKFKVLDQNGNKLEDIDLSKDVFGIEPHEQALYDAVRMYNANSRQATAKTKKRDEVRGGGRKPWRQKGTGRARQGSIRSPQFRTGGVVFGPTGQENYKLKQNKKEARLALKSALSAKVKEKALIVVDNLNVESGKTKDMVKLLETLKAKGKTLVVVSEKSTTYETLLALNNLGNVALLFADKIEFEEEGQTYTYFDIGVNVYDLLNSDTVIMTVDAIKNIEEVLA